MQGDERFQSARHLQALLTDLAPPHTPAHLKAIEHCAKQMMAAVVAGPTTSLAFSLCHKAGLCPATQLAHTQLTLLCIAAQQTGLSDAVLRQQLCACLCLFHLYYRQLNAALLVKAPPTPAPAKPPRELIALLHKLQRPIWANALRLAPLWAEPKRLDKLNYLRLDSQLRPLAFYLALASATTAQKAAPRLPWQRALGTLCRKYPEVLPPLTEPLLAHTGLFPPGSRIALKDEMQGLVLSHHDDEALVHNLTTGKCQAIRLTNDMAQQGYQPITNGEEFDAFWSQAWQEHARQYSAQVAPESVWHAPKAVAHLCQEFDKPDPDIARLSRMLEAFPKGKAVLAHNASKASRAGLAITGSRHAIMMQGMQASKQRLVRDSLIASLGHMVFPIRPVLDELLRLRCHIAAMLGEGDDSVFSEDLATLAAFDSAPWYLHPNSQGLATLSPGSDWFTTLLGLGPGKNTHTLQQTALTLARQWRQPQTFTHALAGRGNTLCLRHASYCRLSLWLAGYILFPPRQADFADRLTTALSQAEGGIKLSPEQAITIATEAAQRAHVHCPIPV